MVFKSSLAQLLERISKYDENFEFDVRNEDRYALENIITYRDIKNNNPHIFKNAYCFPTSPNEPDSHFICKIFLGENILSQYKHGSFDDFKRIYEYKSLPPLLVSTIKFNEDIGDDDSRQYQPDIFLEGLDKKNKIRYVSVTEINGGVHYRNKNSHKKNKLRRRLITKYFQNDYKFDLKNTGVHNGDWNYKIIFSYIVFKSEDFLYWNLDFFMDIFKNYFIKGGRYPTVDLYEQHFL